MAPAGTAAMNRRQRTAGLMPAFAGGNGAGQKTGVKCGAGVDGLSAGTSMDAVEMIAETEGRRRNGAEHLPGAAPPGSKMS